MLGQHPDLYSLPELNLFLTDTLGELLDWEGEVGPARGYLAGLKRSVAQIEFGEQSTRAIEYASNWVMKRRAWSTRQMFWWLVESTAPRSLVYKSPRMAMARSSSRRLVAAVPRGHYIHLTRHPVASICDLASQVEEKGSHVNRFFAQLWVTCQQTILETTESLEQQKSLRVKGEDLIGNPEKFLREIVFHLGLPVSCEDIERMKHPEQWPFAYSIPGLHDGDNDADFLANPRLRRNVLRPDAKRIWELDLVFCL